MVVDAKTNDFVYQYIINEIAAYIHDRVPGIGLNPTRALDIRFEADTATMTVEFVLLIRDVLDGRRGDVIWSKRVQDHTKLMLDEVAAEVALVVNA